jgi:hypothetical protein
LERRTRPNPDDVAPLGRARIDCLASLVKDGMLEAERQFRRVID